MLYTIKIVIAKKQKNKNLLTSQICHISQEQRSKGPVVAGVATDLLIGDV